jgi:hypothetical protein
MIKPKLYGLGQDGAVGRNFKQINPSSGIIQVHLNYWVFNNKINEYGDKGS